MRNPHQMYVDYLLTLDLDDMQVARLLEMDDLSVPSPAELARRRFELAVDRPEAHDLYDLDDPSVATYLRAHGIVGLLSADAITREAASILRNPILRETVEVLVLGGIDAVSIVGFCNRHSLPTVSEKGVLAFGLIFWNVRSMGFEDVRKHLRAIPEGATYATPMTMDPEQVLAFAEMLLARRRDYHVLAAMPRHPDMSMAVPEG